MKKLLLLSCAAALGIGASAQESTCFIQTEDSVTIYEIMHQNAPGLVNYKDVPRFALIGKENKFYLGIGANLKFVGTYDWGHPIDDANDFDVAKIPMSVKPGDGGKTQFSVGQSNIYFNFVALPGTDNQLGIYLDINFMGESNKAVALHHAYLKYRGITAGYVVSTFTDAGAQPAAIDFYGPNSITFDRHPNISYTQKFGKDKMWSAALGLDMPDLTSYTLLSPYQQSHNMNYQGDVNQRMPDIPLYIQRSWAGGDGWLRASAIFRDLMYRNQMSAKAGGNKNQSALGWGVKLSGKTPVCGGLSAYYQAVYGQGVSSYIKDLAGEGLDLVPNVDKNGHLQTVKAWGAYGTLRYDFSPKVFMDMTYSQVRAYAPTDAVGGETYKYGQYVTGNLFWNINSFTQLGVEYLWGRRVNLDNTQAHDNRIMLMLQVGI